MKSFISTFLLCSILSYNVNVRAEHGDDDSDAGNNDDQGENCQGGNIDGSETLVATVALVPTTNAPADAGGVAKLLSQNENGVVTYSFSLSITGLTTGVYNLSVVRKSDGSTNDLGQFTVSAACHEDDQGENEDDQGENEQDGDEKEGEHSMAAFLGEIQLPPN